MAALTGGGKHILEQIIDFLRSMAQFYSLHYIYI